MLLTKVEKNNNIFPASFHVRPILTPHIHPVVPNPVLPVVQVTVGPDSESPVLKPLGKNRRSHEFAANPRAG